jgi:hypothetical protein
MDIKREYEEFLTQRFGMSRKYASLVANYIINSIKQRGFTAIALNKRYISGFLEEKDLSENDLVMLIRGGNQTSRVRTAQPGTPVQNSKRNTLTNITEDELNEFFDYMIESGHSPSTAQHYVRIINRIRKLPPEEIQEFVNATGKRKAAFSKFLEFRQAKMKATTPNYIDDLDDLDDLQEDENEMCCKTRLLRELEETLLKLKQKYEEGLEQINRMLEQLQY